MATLARKVPDPCSTVTLCKTFSKCDEHSVKLPCFVLSFRSVLLKLCIATEKWVTVMLLFICAGMS